MIKKCEFCDHEFYTKPSYIKKGNGRFCSPQCVGKWRQKFGFYQKEKHPRWSAMKRNCKTCNKEIFVSGYALKTNRGQYCSRKCYARALRQLIQGRKYSDKIRLKISKTKIGKLNPAYKHGQNIKMARYNSGFTRLTHEKVFRKHGKKCIRCGSATEILVHHKDFNPKNNSVNNLIPLCQKCHKFVHKNHVTFQDVGSTPLPTGLATALIANNS